MYIGYYIIHIYIYMYVFIPQSSSLVRPFCSHTSLALPLSAHHKPPTSAGSPGLEPLALHSGRVSSTRTSVSRDPLHSAKPQALSPPRAVCKPGAPGSRALAEPPNFFSPSSGLKSRASGEAGCLTPVIPELQGPANRGWPRVEVTSLVDPARPGRDEGSQQVQLASRARVHALGDWGPAW